MSQVDDPTSILKDFVQGLPETIRDIVAAQTLLAFRGDDGLTGNVDSVAALLEEIDRMDGAAKAYRAAAVSGALEYALHRDDADRIFARNLAADHPDDELFNRMSLQAELKNRHVLKAAEELRSLRTGALSAPALKRWTVRHLAENPPLRSST